MVSIKNKTSCPNAKGIGTLRKVWSFPCVKSKNFCCVLVKRVFKSINEDTGYSSLQLTGSVSSPNGSNVRTRSKLFLLSKS